MANRWSESYFYRRVLDAVGFFEPGPWRGVDPFAPLKRAELESLDPRKFSLSKEPENTPLADERSQIHFRS